MELRQYFNIIWKWLWLIILAVLIAAGASYLASRAATPLYQTKTTLLVGQGTQNLNLNSYDLYIGQQLAQTYAELVRREPVLKGVVQSLGLNRDWTTLIGQVSARAVPNTQLVEVYVADSDPYRAKVLADAVAQQLIRQSPTNPNALSPDQAEFTKTQLSDLQKKIQDAQTESDRLHQELDASNSARQIQNLNNQVSLLDQRVTDWQKTYSQLLLTQGTNSVAALNVLEEATIPTFPISPNTRMNVLLAAALGLVLAVAGAFLVEYLDDTIKTAEDAMRAANLPLLGAIARIDGENYSDKLIAVRQPLSPTVEAYRVVRTNIQFSSIDHPARTLLVTSPNPSEGKSIMIANLGVVMAQSGMKVIIVDTDMRRPVQHRIFDLPNRDGVSDAIIRSQVSVTDHLQETGVENLSLMSSGSLPPNPAELLGSERMLTIIEELKQISDIVLFDSPPTLVVTDAAILGSRTDGALLVNDSGNTRTTEARRAADELRRLRVNLLGVVLNRVPVGGRGSYYYYSYYSTDQQKKANKASRKSHDRKGTNVRATAPATDKSQERADL
ncbi:MAG: Non-specific protein-tyrosine kinase [Chloroflexi bacterium]|nr:Non-specific protein-tyrosine kinase [Chloroflexota bacterium]